MRRTVTVEFNPCPRRPMTTPEKIWIRSLSPSTTFVWTLTESPTPKSTGFLRYCSDSILSSNAWFINSAKHYGVVEHWSDGERIRTHYSNTPSLRFLLIHQIRPAFRRAQ